MKNDPKRLLIAGYFGYGNTGDEAILSAMIGDFRAAIPGVDIVVVSGNPEDTRANHRVEAVCVGDLLRIIEAASGSDLVILGGGGLFHDYWEFEPELIFTSRHAGMTLYGSVALLARSLQKPLMLYAVGVGPLNRVEGKKITRAIADLADAISVRDVGSKEILGHIGVDISEVIITADPAFRIKVEECPQLMKEKTVHPGPILGVSLRYWDFDGSSEDMEAQLGSAINEFLESHDGRAVFIPFQTGEEKILNDLAVAERVKSFLVNSERAYILEGKYSPAELAGIVGECDLMLSMRMHAIVFAVKSGVPVVGLVYDPKVASIMGQAGINEYAIDYSGINSKKLSSMLESAYENIKTLRPQLIAAGKDLADKALQNAEAALMILKEKPGKEKPITDAAESLLSGTALSLSLAFQESKERSQTQIHLLTDKADELKVSLKNMIANHREELRKRDEKLLQIEKEIDGMKSELASCKVKHNEQILELEQKEADILGLNAQLAEIKGSRAWKIIWWLWEVRAFLAPKGSYREQILKAIRKVFKDNPIQTLKKIRNWFQKRYSIRMTREAFAFDQFKRSRSAVHAADLQTLRLPSQAGLVSIVLPVYNGSDFIEEALDSVLNQTYKNFELIAINDGSQDNTGEILDRYAEKDERIRVYHQQNIKLPGTLSRGFQEARGEYLTWISHDNRFKPDFLERMIACLERHPSWDMIYANLDIIGEDSLPLKGTDYYRGYQRPPGSDHIHLPKDTAELNTSPNNFIGGGFLYRDRVAWLIGDYSGLRYTREDYDYWMRVNSLLTLRHADFKDPVYDYRFHSDSLTNQDEKLGITRDRRNLMVFDDFRRDFFTIPLIWFIAEDSSAERPSEQISDLRTMINNAGHMVVELDQYSLPGFFLPTVYLRITPDPNVAPPIPESLPENALKVLLCIPPVKNLPKTTAHKWDICLAIGSDFSPVRMQDNKGWMVSNDGKAVFTAIDILARSKQLEVIEREIALDKGSDLKISVIICTYNRQDHIKETLESVSRQSMSREDYEIIVVNNDPENNQVDQVVEQIREEHFSNCPEKICLIDCPILGLSLARNAGIGEARGEVLYFLDDDAAAEEKNLELFWEAFQADPDAGVIGGQIKLDLPDKMPMIWKDGWEKYWSQLITEYSEYRKVENWWDYPWGANWCARRTALLRIGGFRAGYGRRGNDYSGGEEIIAAILIGKLGYSIGILPEAKVIHHIDLDRLSIDHLRNTIKAGLFTQYQAQVQLHIHPRRNSFRDFKRLNRNIFMNISKFLLPSRKNKAERLEAYFYGAARGKLMYRRIMDSIKRLRKPITQK